MKTINNHIYDDGAISEIVVAIKQFVQRQELIKQAITDLGITENDLSNSGPLSWTQKNIPQEGIWARDQQWQYFLHGKGCRLSNLATGEVIDWNSTSRFAINIDPYVFIDHLNWRIKQGDSFQHILKATSNKEDGLEFLLPLVFYLIDKPEYVK